MKKKIILFTSSIALLTALTMSFKQGPAHVQQNRSGGPGSMSSCSASGCHTGAGALPSFVFQIKKASNNQPVLMYMPDTTYIITMVGSQHDPSLTHFGFMFHVVDSSQTTVSVGSYSAFPTGVDTATITFNNDNRTFVEHNNAALPAVNNNYTVSFRWKAPSVGVGTVEFWGILNAVNNDGAATSADTCSLPQRQFVKQTSPTSVAQLNADLKVNAYPNPVTDKLNITLDNADNGAYTISVFDVQGKVISKQTANVSKSYQTSINTSAWAAGMYHVQLEKDGAKKVIAVRK